MPTPRFYPGDADGMHSALFAWVTSQIAKGGLLLGLAAAPYQVVWADQDAPYPGHPFATLELVSPPESVSGQPYRTLSNKNTSPTDRIEYDAEMTLRVELFSRAPRKAGIGTDETSVLISALDASLKQSAVKEALAAAGCPYLRSLAPVSVPAVTGFGYERRSYFDAIFSVRMMLERPANVMDSTTFAAGTRRGVVTVESDGVTIDGSVGGT